MSGQDLQSPGRAGAAPASTTALSLTDDQCWAYHPSQQLGRVAITVDDQPLVFPVNYVVGEKSVVFRTAPGTELAHGPGSKACFEIDSYDPHSREGWSVMAIGMLEEITDAQDQQSNALRQLPVHPIAPGVRLHWIALRLPNTRVIRTRADSAASARLRAAKLLCVRCDGATTGSSNRHIALERVGPPRKLST